MPEPTVLLLSTSDTDLISARSSGKNYRWANPSRLSDLELTDLLAEASIVVIRILGGYRAWQSGIDTVIAGGVPAVLVSGEQAADAELTDRSTVAAGTALQAHIYLAHGGVDNLRELHAFLCDTVLMTGFGFTPPVATPTWGVLERPDAGKTGPTIAVLYYRAQHLAGNTGYVEALCRAIEDAGGRPLPLYCASLRTAEPRLLERLGGADAMVVTVLAAGGVKPAAASAHRGRDRGDRGNHDPGGRRGGGDQQRHHEECPDDLDSLGGYHAHQCGEHNSQGAHWHAAGGRDLRIDGGKQERSVADRQHGDHEQTNHGQHGQPGVTDPDDLAGQQRKTGPGRFRWARSRSTR
ncbi:cobalamin biosynthesis protein CobN [Mycobacterium tuberculosis TB_RSA09]|nr:cobalamin biosynthesis protein CobN [Mycobacterium tuberculosis TB_RSA01]KBN46356.1 cobalamin biosynthesis protein CobN [Mycobacterium tuberculosis TB_RSA02]KBN71669.1 cobalamin biosynthesis protein CobN [Mycobacterium tuberculosis TB_RSA09]KBN75008.1 cobalamin biosynthesis protein CobN [Mycobacterium tuberculosis TB_RSA10]